MRIAIFALCLSVLAVGSDIARADEASDRATLAVQSAVANLAKAQADLEKRVSVLEGRAKSSAVASSGFVLPNGTPCPCPYCPANVSASTDAKPSFLNPPAGSVKVCDENGCRWVVPSGGQTFTANDFQASGTCASGQCGQSFGEQQGYAGVPTGTTTHKHPVLWRLTHPFGRR